MPNFTSTPFTNAQYFIKPIVGLGQSLLNSVYYEYIWNIGLKNKNSILEKQTTGKNKAHYLLQD